MKAALLRVGIDTGSGGILSPIFDDNSFEFLPIPEYYNLKHIKSPLDEKRTYSTLIGRCGIPMIEYFREGANKEKHRNCIVHVDPEFETFTYGDPCFNKGSLKDLNNGDYLIFYAGLKGYGKNEPRKGLYVIGYFEVDYSVVISDIKQYSEVAGDFSNNFHVRHQAIFQRDVSTKRNKGLKLVKGTDKSRLLKYAYKISQKKIYGKYKYPIDVLSNDIQGIFGDFNGKISIMRNSLRWIKEKRKVETTVSWLKSL